MNFRSAVVYRILDMAPDATVLVDQRGVIIFANSLIQDMLGYEPGELVGQSVNMLLPERFRKQHPSHIQGYFGNPRIRSMGQSLDLWALCKHGAEIPVEVNLSPFVNEGQHIACASIRDMSKHYQIQEEMKTARLQAEQANHAKSTFLAAASHDLRQPLQTLNLLNGILKRQVIVSDVLKLVDDQAEALRTIKEMLNSLLDISRLEAGVIVPDIRNHSVGKMFERLSKRFAETALIKGIDIIVEETDATISSDDGLLMHILHNLVSNAIQYTNKGHIRLRCVRDQSRIGIQVLDTGIGIPKDKLNIIFDEFYQIDHAERNQEGFGLGLAVVRRLVELLGHQLELDSIPGQGSCFTVFVPIGSAVDQPARVPLSTVTNKEPLSEKRILLVDDSLSVLDATKTLLEIEGYTVISAASGKQALEQVIHTGYSPDVIICDLHIQEAEHGISLIKELNGYLGKTVPSIVTTGDTSRSVREIIKEVDNCVLLYKPVTIDLLLDTLNSLLVTPVNFPGDGR
jgi:PAS domain S-box-containing protein